MLVIPEQLVQAAVRLHEETCNILCVKAILHKDIFRGHAYHEAYWSLQRSSRHVCGERPHDTALADTALPLRDLDSRIASRRPPILRPSVSDLSWRSCPCNPCRACRMFTLCCSALSKLLRSFRRFSGHGCRGCIANTILMHDPRIFTKSLYAELASRAAQQPDSNR